MSTQQQFHQQFASEFGKFEERLNGSKTHPIHQVRKELLDRFSHIPFPTVSDEEWKYTNINPLAAADFKQISESSEVTLPQSLFFDSISDIRIVFKNGIFSSEDSTLKNVPEGIEILSFAEAVKKNYSSIAPLLKAELETGGMFETLNGAFSEQGTVIIAHKNVVLPTPVHIVYYSDFSSTGYQMPRTILIGESFSKFTVIESFHGNNNSKYFSNAVVQVVLEENADCEHVKIQDESTKAFHISTIKTVCAAHSRFRSYNVNFGGSIVRNDVSVVFSGENAECYLNGLTLSNDTQLVDNHTFIDHAVPHCTSNELYKALLGGKSRGVFNGKVLVRKDAQKTLAYQQNKSILLTGEARMDAKPQLEIFADDVKCSHGATIGQLDKEAKFYLKSRGFSEELANTTLVYAFASDVVHHLDITEVRDFLETRIAEKLSHERS